MKGEFNKTSNVTYLDTPLMRECTPLIEELENISTQESELILYAQVHGLPYGAIQERIEMLEFRKWTITSALQTEQAGSVPTRRSRIARFIGRVGAIASHHD